MAEANDGSYWVCGGKNNGYSISNECVKVSAKMANETLSVELSEQTITESSLWPGQYFESSGFFCELDNQGGVHKSNDPKEHYGCLLSLNDGSTNYPLCFCCNLDESSMVRGQMKCDNLFYTNQCAPRLDSCVIDDDTNNRLIQIGGYYGSETYDDILVELKLCDTHCVLVFSCSFFLLVLFVILLVANKTNPPKIKHVLQRIIFFSILIFCFAWRKDNQKNKTKNKKPEKTFVWDDVAFEFGCLFLVF